MTYQRVTIDYNNLIDCDFCPNETTLYTITKNNAKFDFMINRKSDSDKAICFGTGAVAKHLALPVFSRVTWMDDFDCSTIFYADPTLYEVEKSSLTWYYGHNDEWYLETIAAILSVIFKKWNINYSSVEFTGSSGGGYSSIVLATLFKGSIATVINPQVDISTFSEPHYVNFVNDLLDGDRSKVIEDRKKVLNLFVREEYFPYLHIIQNFTSPADFENQILPFIAEASKILNLKINHFVLDFYNEDGGHNAMPSKEETIRLILEDLNKTRVLEQEDNNPVNQNSFHQRLLNGEFFTDETSKNFFLN